MKSVIDWIEKLNISIGQWIVGFFGIVLIRFFLEIFSSKAAVNSVEITSLIHFSLFFLADTLALMSLVVWVTKKNKAVTNLSLITLPIIWIAPIIDLVVSLGKGEVMKYVFAEPYFLIKDFFTFLGSRFSYGATIGLRIEILLVLGGILWYLLYNGVSKAKSALVTVGAYIIMFLALALPSLLYILFRSAPVWVTYQPTHIASFIIAASSALTTAGNALSQTVQFVSSSTMIEVGFDKLMTQVLFLIVSFLIFIWFKLIHPEKLRAILKNSRWERVSHYLLLVIVGAAYAYTLGLGAFTGWVNWFGFCSLLVSWYAAWMYAVTINDLADVAIDSISNTERPIVQGVLTGEEMKNSGYVWLLISFVGSWAAGFYPFVLMLVYTAAFYVYSAGYIRLKRIPILSSFLISIACLSSVLAGFFFLSGNKDFNVFPSLTAFGIIVLFTLGTNFRDLKDVAGDAAEGMWTLPVLFRNYGRHIVGGMLALSFLLSPIFLSTHFLYAIAVPAAVLGFLACVHEPYKEKYIFAVYFLYVIGGITLYLL